MLVDATATAEAAVPVPAYMTEIQQHNHNSQYDSQTASAEGGANYTDAYRAFELMMYIEDYKAFGDQSGTTEYYEGEYNREFGGSHVTGAFHHHVQQATAHYRAM